MDAPSPTTNVTPRHEARGTTKEARGISSESRGLTTPASDADADAKGGGSVKQARRRPTRGVRPIRPAALAHMRRVGGPAGLVWTQFNPHPNAPNNCPATAASMDRFLGTGRIVAAPGGDHVTTYTYANVRFAPAMTQAELLAFIRSARFPSNHFIMVIGRRSDAQMQQHNLTRHHYFVLAHIRARGVPNGRYYIDAFGSGYQAGPTIAAVTGALNQLACTSYRFSRGRFRVTGAQGSVRDLDGDFPPGME